MFHHAHMTVGLHLHLDTPKPQPYSSSTITTLHASCNLPTHIFHLSISFLNILLCSDSDCQHLLPVLSGFIRVWTLASACVLGLPTTLSEYFECGLNFWVW